MDPINFQIFIRFFACLLLLAATWASRANAATFLCNDRVSNQVIEVGPRTKISACVEDVVWGAQNVCFYGDAMNLVTAINRGEYDRISDGLLMRDAKYNKSRDQIEFIGVIQMSFYMNTSDIGRCP